MLTIFYNFLWVVGAEDLPYCIPTGAGAVRHESFEVDRFETMPRHDFIESLPHDTLCLTILGLHVTNSNRHHTRVP